MRSMLEGSWNPSMGVVPSDPRKAAEAAAESIADAMGQSKNVLMVDLRLPSYDITEGANLYNIMSTYDFCSFLSDNLRERKLIRKSLVLVRDESERAEIDRQFSQKDGFPMADADDIATKGDGEVWGADLSGSEVDDFRKSLMTSWDSTGDEAAVDSGVIAPSSGHDKRGSKSHRLWSMVGSENISSGPDMFDQAIAAVDKHARLATDEDALIIISPYDTTDVIAVRRIMARYGQTRTVVIVNSRMETLPRELDSGVLVYGLMPLIARKSMDSDAGEEAGLRAVVMKRYPRPWAVYVDVYGDGFVETEGTQPVIDSSEKQFPSPEWIVQRVQAHVESQ
ncbi:hypothetical protein ACHAWF_010576 [Thalassiosira exigua]